MSKQEKASKKAKQAAAKAAEIIDQAVAAVKAKAIEATAYDAERKEGCTDEEWLLAVQVREQRDAGVAWWQIAQTLGLPGAGASASTGKAGAAQARKAYAKGFGAHPRSFTRGQGRTRREKNETVRTINATTKRARVEKVRTGLGGAIDPAIPNEELADILKGRKIQWMIMGDICPEGLEKEAWIHPKAPLYVIGEGAERQIEFREYDPKAPLAVRALPGHIRTVRLDRIFSVKGHR